MMRIGNRADPDRRLKCLVALLVLTGLVCFGFKKPIQREFMTWLITRAGAPSETALRDLLDQTRDPVALLEKLWNTGKIVHRQFVSGYLKDQSSAKFQLDDRTRSLLMAGTRDADLSVRELAFGALTSHKFPGTTSLAGEQLRDPDPQVRLLGLQYLQKAGPQKVLRVVFALLDDPDLSVVTSADAALRKWTGQDFGIRISQSIPVKSSSQRETLDPANVEAVRRGVQRWKEWWDAHQEIYPPTDSTPVTSVATAAPRLPEDFALRDLTGEKVRLSDYRGKVVLLNFWTTWCPACLVEIPDLIELQRKHADRLIVLGISLDGVADEHGHDHEENGSEHEAVVPRQSKAQGKTLSTVERIVRNKGITYPVWLDPQNAVGSRFNGGELPTNVLIDPNGCVRRRFIGARPLPVLEAIIAEIATASNPPLR
ncbi:MAG: redoxin domain-containing protein [Verrucomicrobiota bacterium]